MNWNEVEIHEANISHASSIRQLKNKLYSDEILIPQFWGIGIEIKIVLEVKFSADPILSGYYGEVVSMYMIYYWLKSTFRMI